MRPDHAELEALLSSVPAHVADAVRRWVGHVFDLNEAFQAFEDAPTPEERHHHFEHAKALFSVAYTVSADFLHNLDPGAKNGASSEELRDMVAKLMLAARHKLQRASSVEHMNAEMTARRGQS
jgi:hypothetical protein